MIHFFAKIVALIFGHSIDLPCPVLHKWGVTYGNSYISTTAMMYQVYFWAKYFGIIVALNF